MEEQLTEENSEDCRFEEDYFSRTVSSYDEFDIYAWNKGKGYTAPNFPMFTNKLEGLESGLYLFAGESNSGKSAFLSNLLMDFCTNPENDLFGIYFSLDDSSNEIIPRLMAMHEKIPISVCSKPQRYQEAADSGEDGSAEYLSLLEKRKEGIEWLKRLNRRFRIEDSRKIECGEDIFQYLKALKTYLERESPGTGIIAAIDSLSDISFMSSRFKSDKELNDFIAKETKRWSTVLDIPILGSLHLRKFEQSRRPSISDVKESGRYAYEASALFLIHNDVSKNKQSAAIYGTNPSGEEKLPVIEVDWAKNKKSSYKGRTYCYFIPEYSLVTECGTEAAKRFDTLIYSN